MVQPSSRTSPTTPIGVKISENRCFAGSTIRSPTSRFVPHRPPPRREEVMVLGGIFRLWNLILMPMPQPPFLRHKPSAGTGGVLWRLLDVNASIGAGRGLARRVL